MANPRTPKAKAEVTGVAGKKRKKFEARIEPAASGPLGDPPAWLTDTDTNMQRSAWVLIKKEIPWLTEHDRILVQMAASIQGRFMAQQEVGIQAMNMLRQILGQMGATPADRTKVTMPDAGEAKDDLLDG